MRPEYLFTKGKIVPVDPKTPKKGDLRVWWIPQVPMKAFNVYVTDITQALLVLNLLGYYDLFQLENNIKPDYSNAGGLTVYEEGEWVEWCSPEDCESIDEYRDRLEEELEVANET